MFMIILMYANAKSCVRVGNYKSELFCSNIAVWQGEDLSPLLFLLCLNDLLEFIAHTYNGLEDISDMSKILHRFDVSQGFFKQ